MISASAVCAVVAATAATGAFALAPVAVGSAVDSERALQSSAGVTALGGGYPDLPASLPRPAAMPSAAPGGAEIGSAGSLNWSGYAVSKRKVTFQSVKATFFVPYLNCVKSPGQSMSSEWAGLDGFVGRSRSVEQAGIAADCSATGKASYAAWFEMFPLPQSIVPIRIHGGDSVTVQVAYKASDKVFSLKLTDNTRGDRFARYRKCPVVRVGGKRLRCLRGSAEVIAEAPATVRHGHLVIDHLSDYGAISFAAIQIADDKGKRGGIVSPRWNATKITQVRSPTGPLLARPTPIQLNMFDSYWLRED